MARKKTKTPVATKTPEELARQRSFNASQFSRTIDIGTSSNINADLINGLETLRGRCRYMAQNDPYISQYLTLLKSNVIGHGPALHPQVRKTDDTLDEKTNRILKDSWLDFLEYGNATTCKSMSGTTLQQLIIESVARDGECLIHIKRGAQYGELGYALSFIAIEQLPSQYIGTAPNGNVIFQSVEVNSDFAVQAYWVHSIPQSRQNAYLRGHHQSTPDLRIPVEDCFHLFEKRQPNQLRGVPWIVTSVLNLSAIDLYKEAELVNARVASANRIFLTTERNQDGILLDEDKLAVGDLGIDLQNGGIGVLPPGYSATSVDWSAPNEGLSEFLRAQLKGVASGLNISYAALSNDLENVNFSSAKFAFLQDQTQYKNKLDWFLDTFLTRLYRDFIKYQLANGNIPLPANKYKRYCKIKWIGKGFKSANLLEQARALTMLSNLGIMSKSQISSEIGLDWEETVAQIAQENSKMEKLGVQIVNDVDILKLDLMYDQMQNSDSAEPS